MWWTVSVPVSLLHDNRLPHAARALYMTLLSQCPAEATECRLPSHELMRLSRFGSPITLATHLKHLQNTGWITITQNRGRTACTYRLYTQATQALDRSVVVGRGNGEAARVPRETVHVPEVIGHAPGETGHAPGKTVRVPGALVTLAPVSPGARWLYAFLLTKCGRGSKRHRSRQTDLAAEAGIGSRVTVRALITELRQAGWLWVETADRTKGWTYELMDPHIALRRTELRRVKARLRRAAFVGEGLAKELLTLLINDARFEDNARLNILVNPRTGEPMELDRWYPEAKVAVEFHGSQHFAPSEKFSEEEVNEQQARDLMKDSLARKHKIRLLIMTAQALTIEAVTEMFQGVMPLRTVREEDPVVRWLRERARSYLRRVADIQSMGGGTSNGA